MDMDIQPKTASGYYIEDREDLNPRRLVYWGMPAVRPTPRLLLAVLLLLPACAPKPAISPALRQALDPPVTFAELKEDPERYRGRIVLLGGEVLSARRLQAGTRIEILQLPLGNDDQPQRDRTRSEGRFLAYKKAFLDPATLPASTRVTVAGEVTGSQSLPLDEIEYTYPTLAIKELKVWPEEESPPYPYYGYYGPYYYPHPYGPPFRPYWRFHPYWW